MCEIVNHLKSSNYYPYLYIMWRIVVPKCDLRMVQNELKLMKVYRLLRYIILTVLIDSGINFYIHLLDNTETWNCCTYSTFKVIFWCTVSSGRSSRGANKFLIIRVHFLFLLPKVSPPFNFRNLSEHLILCIFYSFVYHNECLHSNGVV